MVPPILRGQALTAGLLLAVAAAYLHPSLGAEEGPLRPDLSSKLAVALIFLIQGLGLPTRRLLASAANLRFHLFCLAGTFALAPALMLAIVSVAGSWIPERLLPGLLFLSVLPTTISSATILTSNAGGETSAALLATTLSNLLGVLLTPLLCLRLVALSESVAPPFWPVFFQLLLLVLAPLALGQIIRPFVRESAAGQAAAFRRISNALILFIVYLSFCQSFAAQSWSLLSSLDFATLAAAVIVFLVALSAMAWLGGPLAGGSPELRIAAFFCASQKTLAAGAPMAALIFAALPNSGASLAILPIMIHHPLQLALGSSLIPALFHFRHRRAAVR